MKVNGIKKYLLISAGVLSVIIGAVGIILPVLPTTPFLLLAAFCFLKSSPKLYSRLLSNRVLGPYVHNYMKYRAVTLRSKVIALFLLWLFLIISIILIDSVIVKLLLVAIGTGVSIHLLTLKTITPEMKKEDRDPEELL